MNAAAAERMELVDEIVPFEECVRRSDITVIAIPVGSAVKMLPQVLDIFKDEGNGKKIVIDTCSTKSNIVRAAHYHPLRCRFVATHPMAGTEYSGPWAAMPNLFDGRACIFANTEDSDPQAVKVVEELYDALNMRPLFMNADSHDVHTAYVSHISHVTSFALALTVLEKERMRSTSLTLRRVDSPRPSGWPRAPPRCGPLSWRRTGTMCCTSLTHIWKR